MQQFVAGNLESDKCEWCLAPKSSLTPRRLTLRRRIISGMSQNYPSGSLLRLAVPPLSAAHRDLLKAAA
tara:strand:- start:613 stop:819 length:207 start_codon:yes stop_codon:yes gene_type:complete